MTQDTLTKPCILCGSPFEGEPWKKLCLACYIKNKEKKAESSPPPSFDREQAALKQELATAKQDVRRLTIQLDRINAQLAMAQAEVARGRMGRTRTTGPSLSKDMLRFLRQRCHPDRCTDTSMANDVMQWLNRL